MVRIISDSSTLFSTKEAKAAGFDIAPLSVTVLNANYKEYDEISTDELLYKISEGGIPMSSQPAVGDFVEIFNRYPDDELIVITMGDGLSGTYNAACLAKNLADNSENITVINSRTLCGPQREMVLKAVSLANSGADSKTITDKINEQIKTTCSFLIPRDFVFLKRGGRLNPLVAEIGRLINLVPVLTLSHDAKSLVSFSKQRTLAKAVDKVAAHMIKLGINTQYKLYITHAGALKESEAVLNQLLTYFPNIESEIHWLSPVFTTQGGPECIAIQAVLK